MLQLSEGCRIIRDGLDRIIQVSEYPSPTCIGLSRLFYLQRLYFGEGYLYPFSFLRLGTTTQKEDTTIVASSKLKDLPLHPLKPLALQGFEREDLDLHFHQSDLISPPFLRGPLFSDVFSFRQVTQEIFSELHGTKPTVIFPRHIHGVQMRDGGGYEAPTPPGGTGPPPRRASTWCGAHRPLPRLPFRLFKPLRPKTLSTQSEIHEKFRRHRRHQP